MEHAHQFAVCVLCLGKLLSFEVVSAACHPGNLKLQLALAQPLEIKKKWTSALLASLSIAYCNTKNLICT